MIAEWSCGLLSPTFFWQGVSGARDNRRAVSFPREYDSNAEG